MVTDSSIMEVIRAVGREFSDVPNDILAVWIDLCRPLVSEKKFGKLYKQAMAFLVCHRMKIAGYGSDTLSALGFSGASSGTTSIGSGNKIQSISDGQSSISFASDRTSASGSGSVTESNYALTDYGLQYLELRRLAVVPITCGGDY